MPDYIEYQKSISQELISLRNRVRYFINDHHWGEDGRYKEVIFIDMLRKHLPSNVSIGTGFVINGERTTTQIDILIYQNDCPMLFKQGEFVIAPAESVLGMIEVKSSLSLNKAKEAIEKATKNGEIIGRKIFNGIFAYDTTIRRWNAEAFQDCLARSNGHVNYICFGKDVFCKHWDENQLHGNLNAHYTMYKIEDLSFGYFISNLVEDIYIETQNKPIPQNLRNMFYPIQNTKEAHRIFTVPISFDYD